MNSCKFGGDTHVLKPVHEYDMNLTYNIVPVFAKERVLQESGKNGIYIDPISWTNATSYHLSSLANMLKVVCAKLY